MEPSVLEILSLMDVADIYLTYKDMKYVFYTVSMDHLHVTLNTIRIILQLTFTCF